MARLYLGFSLFLNKSVIDFHPGDSSELTKFWVQQFGHRGQPGGRGEARGGGEVADRPEQVENNYFIISTEGALRRPITFDNHPIPSIHV